MSSRPAPPQKTYKTVLAGGVAGMISKTCTAPLERTQMLNQTGATHDSIIGTLRNIFRKTGVRGLWRGNATNCIRVFPHKSLLFAVNEALQQRMKNRSSSSQFISGAVGGLIATGAIYPIDVVMANLAGTFQKENSNIRVARNIIKENGILGLYTGFGVTCIGAIPYEAVRMGVYAMLRDQFQSNNPDNMSIHPFTKLCCGAIAGAAAGISTYPTDTIRRMLQVQSAEGMTMYNGPIQCIQFNWRQGGIRRFYHGLSAKLVRVIPDAAILFVAYEALQDLFMDRQKMQSQKEYQIQMKLKQNKQMEM